MMMIKIAMKVSGLVYLWGVSREEDEIHSICKERLKVDRDFEDLEFIETLL